MVLEVANADLEYLRKKLDEFADDANVKSKTAKDGIVTTHRDKERAIAPVGSIGLAGLEDLGGARSRKAKNALLSSRRCATASGSCRAGAAGGSSAEEEVGRESG